MEISQLWKSTYNNQLQQSIYLCHERTMSQIWLGGPEFLHLYSFAKTIIISH